MSNASLCLHKGARPVSREELALIKAPEATKTWFPVSHSKVLDKAEECLKKAGYQIKGMKLGVMRDGSRFFGVMDLEHTIADGVSLAVGVRNSIDKSLPIGFVGGSRVFVCDNLAFSSEILVRRKHTRHGEEDFANRITQAVASLKSFTEAEAGRIGRMKATEMGDDLAHAMILRAYLRGIIPNRLLDDVAKQWSEPEKDWGGPTLWRLSNAFTFTMSGMAERNPQDYAMRTMRLNSLLLTQPAEVSAAAAAA